MNIFKRNSTINLEDINSGVENLIMLRKQRVNIYREFLGLNRKIKILKNEIDHTLTQNKNWQNLDFVHMKKDMIKNLKTELNILLDFSNKSSISLKNLAEVQTELNDFFNAFPEVGALFRALIIRLNTFQKAVNNTSKLKKDYNSLIILVKNQKTCDDEFTNLLKSNFRGLRGDYNIKYNLKKELNEINEIVQQLGSVNIPEERFESFTTQIRPSKKDLIIDTFTNIVIFYLPSTAAVLSILLLPSIMNDSPDSFNLYEVIFLSLSSNLAIAPFIGSKIKNRISQFQSELEVLNKNVDNLFSMKF